MTGIDPTSYKPLYSQIFDILRESIIQGDYGPGDLLPSETELSQHYDVSRNTARRAVEDLVQNGLAIRIQGRGTFVPRSLVDFDLHRLTSFSEEMRFKGLTPSSKVLCFETRPAPAEVAQSLGLDPAARVYYLARVRYGDAHPMAYQHSFLPAALCPGLDRHDFSRESLFTVLEEDYQLKLSWQQQYIKPVVARAAEARALEIPVGQPLLYLQGTAYLARETPIEYKRIYFRGDLYDFSLRSVRV